MIYIYDLLLNWGSGKKFEFFEWEDNDELEYMKKVPIFKISNFNNLLNNNVKVKKSFLDKIYNKTEIYGNRKSEKVEYACVFCNEELTKCIAIEFNEDGDSVYRSNIYIFDIDDVFELGKQIDSCDLDFEILFMEKSIDSYLTRNECIKKRFLKEEINNSYNNDIDKLKYIYYEIFQQDSDDINYIKDKLLYSLENNYNKVHDDIYDLIKNY